MLQKLHIIYNINKGRSVIFVYNHRDVETMFMTLIEKGEAVCIANKIKSWLLQRNYLICNKYLEEVLRCAETN